LVQRICDYIETDPEGPLTLAVLSAHVNISPHHLQRTFKSVMGITPRQYVAARRLSTLKGQLGEGQSVTKALYEAGYGSSSRLYEEASAQLGMTPATYRRGGRGMQISYTVVDCPFGRLLVAATERGICSVSLGDSDAALEAALVAEYPAAETMRDEAGLRKWVTAILNHLRGQEPHLDLPLDLRATAFQRRVWEELRKIPYGTTRSYGEIARAIGRPAAARAVARACATNPAALLIPCHRAVRADGSIGGYRWGLERKRALLAQEGAHRSQPSGREPG
jgi:AraC family transcriptional regulator of adaptative response/methylated-DNA-[protein]-cysteine methyltransferase